MHIIAKITTFVNTDFQIKIYPDLLLAAARGQNGGAVRLWSLAKHTNPGGCGVIPSKALRRFVINDLKVKRGVYDVWLSRALHIGLLRREGKNIKLVGLARAAAILGVNQIKRPMYIELEKLITNGWLPWVWRSWLEVHKLTGKPISRAALKDLSGIPERTQIEYEKQAGVINHANYAIHDQNKTKEEFYNLKIEKGRPVFVGFNNQTLERLPNSREVKDQKITLAPKGRTRRANSQLNDLLNIAGRDHKQTITRRYCQGEKQTNQALKKINDLANKGAHGLPVFVYQEAEKKGFWHAIQS